MCRFFNIIIDEMKSQSQKQKQAIHKTAIKFLNAVDTNPYCKTQREKEFLKTVISLYETYPKHYIKMLLSQKNKKQYGEILKWIDNCIKDLLIDTSDFTYALSTKLNWIVHGRTSFPKCEHEGCNEMIGWQKNCRMSDVLTRFCSTKCSTGDDAVVKKSRQTRINEHGQWNSKASLEKAKMTLQQHIAEDIDFIKNIHAKMKKTCLEKYGDENYNNRNKSAATYKQHCIEYPNFKANQVERLKETKKKRYGNENYVNAEKSIETRRRKNNGAYRTKEQQKQISQTFQSNHNGMTSTFQLPNVQDKCKQAFLKKFGVDSPLKSNEVRKKIIDKWIHIYGTDHPWKNTNVQQKNIETQLKRYSTLAHNVKYLYDGISFDSSWELAVWIFCKDNDIKIEKPNESIRYEYNGKVHLYFPDLKINDEFVEIKGDQFFDESGKMRCPFRYKEWTDEEYDKVCAIYEAKHQCMLKNNVKILRLKDIAFALKFIKDKYGVKYLKQFQTQSTHKTDTTTPSMIK